MIRVSKSTISKKEINAVSRVLKKEYLGMGHEVNIFEKKLEKFLKNKCVCVSSGTAALHLACQSLGLSKGDEVLVQSITYISSFQAISATGAKPVACEVNPLTLTIDINDLLRKINSKTKAIMPVHYAGNAGELDKIYSIAKKYKLRVIEDAAHAFGSYYKKHKIGHKGDIICFSFDGIKNITTGEGGCILTNNKKIYEYCKQYHDHGHELNPKFPRGMDTVSRPGFNYRMTELQGAVGIAQLKKLNFILSENKKRYDLLLHTLSKKFKIRYKIKDSISSMDTFMFEVPNNRMRSKIVNYLRKSGIGIKNVPDAIRWHFASYWEHAISKKQINSIKKSKNKVKKYVAIPISIKVSKQTYSKVAKKIISLIIEQKKTKVNR